MLHLSLGADAGESLSPHFLEALQITDLYLSLVISRLHQVIDSFFWLSFYTGAVILQDRVCLSACQPFAPCAARGELLQKKHAMRALCARCRRPSDRPGRSVFDLSESGPPLAWSEGPAPPHQKIKYFARALRPRGPEPLQAVTSRYKPLQAVTSRYQPLPAVTSRS